MECVRIQWKEAVETRMRERDATLLAKPGAMGMRALGWCASLFGLFVTGMGIMLVQTTPMNAPFIVWAAEIALVCVGPLTFAFPAISRSITRSRIARKVKGTPAEMATSEVSFTPEGIQERSADSDVQLSWQVSPLVIENVAGFLVKFPSTLCTWFDSTWFHSQAEADQVAAWARAGAGKYKVIRPIKIPAFKPAVDDFSGHVT